MTVDIIMPRLGLTMEEGAVAQWLVAEGDQVEKGQPLLEVETDKVTVEVEAPASGIMGPLLIDVGQQVPVRTVLAQLYTSDEAVRFQPPPSWETQAQPSPAAGADTTVVQSSVASTGAPVREQRRPQPPQEGEARVKQRMPRVVPGRPGVPVSTGRPALPGRAAGAQRLASGHVFSSPRARKRGRELGVDWRRLSGSGTGGRVVERDVLRAAVQPELSEAPRSDLLAPVGSQATRDAAGVINPVGCFLHGKIDARRLLEAHRRLCPSIRQETGGQLSLTDWLVRIAGALLAAFPQANVCWDPTEGRVRDHQGNHVAVGLCTAAGAATGLIQDAHRKSLAQIVVARQAMQEQAQEGQVAAKERPAAAMLVLDASEVRSDTILAPPTPPQSIVLAMTDGDEGRVGLSLACDQRMLDWALASQLFERAADLIEEPYGLLLA